MPLPDDPRAAFDLPEGVLYLDTASHAPRLRAVDRAVREAWAAGAAPWRLGWADWEAWTERVRGLASRLFAADLREDADGVALVPSVAHAMSALAAHWPLRAGEAVAVLEGEFPSALLPWQARCAAVGARVVAVPRAAPEAALLEGLARGDFALLVLSQVHWRDGRRLDLDRIAAAAQAAGVPLVLDLSQSLGALPCDVAQWRPAAAMSVGYKWWLAGKGLGALWLAPERRGSLPPLEHHWQGRAPAAAWRFEPDAPPPPRPGARLLDGGEIAEPLRLALAEAALSQVLAWTPAAIAARLDALLGRLCAQLEAAGLAGWCVQPRAPHLLGIAPPADRLEAVRAALAREGIVCVERDGVFRLAPHVHVLPADIDRVAAALRSAA